MSTFFDFSAVESTESTESTVIETTSLISPEAQAALDALNVEIEAAVALAASVDDANFIGIPVNEKQLKKFVPKVQAFAKLGVFSSTAGLENGVFVIKEIKPVLFNFFVANNIPVYGIAKVEGVFVPQELELHGHTLPMFQGSVTDKDNKFVLPVYSDMPGRFYEDFESTATFIAKSLINLFSTKTAVELSLFLAEYCGTQVDEQGWVSLLDFEETHFNSVEVNLATAEFRTNRIRKLRNNGFVKRIGEVNVMPLTALIAFQLVGSGIDNQVQLEGFLAALTQVFEEEDTYGKQMEEHDQLRVIRAASVMLLEPVGSRHGKSFPYFYLKNSNKPETISEGAIYYLSRGIICFPDKYYSKRLVVGAKGCAALGVFMYEDKQSMGYITDCSKESKAGTRPWQALTIAASEGYPNLILPSGKISDKPNPDYRPHKRSRFVLSTPDLEDVFIEGDMIWMGAGNSRLDGNGSGCGSSTIGYASKVGKSVTGTLNGINFPAGMTIQEVAASVEAKLAVLVKKPRVWNVNGSVTVFKYQGKDLLRYSGHNQQILIDESSDYEVRCLITSNSITVKLTVNMVSNGYKEPKLRGFGIKVVAKDTGMVILDKNTGKTLPYQLYVGIESRKGDFQAMFHMYANSLPGDSITRHICGHLITYDANNNVLHDSDLADPNSLFYQWKNANIKDVVLVHKLNLDDWKFFVKHHGDSVDKDLTYTIDGDVVTVQETSEVVFGWYPVQLECSTVIESTNASGPILERIAAKYAFDEQLGTNHDIAAQEQVQTFCKMAEMAFNVPGKFEIEVQDVAIPKGISFGKIHQYNNSMLSTGSAKEIGDLVPYLAFNDYNEKVKKSLRKTAFAVTKVQLFKVLPKDDRTPVDAKFAFMPLLGQISKIMTIQVGWTWGMSASLWMAAWIKSYQYRNNICDCNGEMLATEKDVADVMKAASICSLIVHEGLSLAVDPKTLPLFFGKGPEEPEYVSFRSSFKGCHSYNDGEKWINFDRDTTVSELIKNLKAVSGYDCDVTTMNYLTSAFRWVRGMGILESEGLGLSEESSNKTLVKLGRAKGRDGKVFKTAYTFGGTLNEENQEQFVNILGLDDVATTVLMGLCRRMSQGVMGARFDVDEFARHIVNSETEINSEFRSSWQVFTKYYADNISLNKLIPTALLGRIECVGSIWAEMTDFKVEEIKHYENGAGGRFRRSVAATTLDIDTINLGACSRLDAGEALMYNWDVMPFKHEPGSADYTHGAFETQLVHCPVTFVEVDGVKVCKPLCDANTKQFATTKAAWSASYAAELPNGKFREYFNRTTLDAKTILKKAAERYPYGTVLTAKGKDNVQVFIDFGRILRLGSFSAGGSATGIALRIVELLVASAVVPADRKNGYEGEIYSSLSGLSGMMQKWIGPSNMKKGIRGSKDGAGCKTMSSTAPKVQDARIYYWPQLTIKDNEDKDVKVPVCNIKLVNGKFVPDISTAKVFTMPVACINPNDHAKQIANIWEGCIVDVGRTPMVATFMALLLEDESVSLGHLEIAARYQGIVNHGDGDGDPIDFTKMADYINPSDAHAIFANNKYLV
jgi:hypothetical protein